MLLLFAQASCATSGGMPQYKQFSCQTVKGSECAYFPESSVGESLSFGNNPKIK
jgi:hypothetical protein